MTPTEAQDRPIPWTTAEILAATDGTLLTGRKDTCFSGIAIDSRVITAGKMFAAIVGEAHDGHTFIKSVFSKGIRGFLVQSDHVASARQLSSAFGSPGFAPPQGQEIVCVAVNDTVRALGNLARYRRRHANVSVIAITGSNGKTTTKEMTAAVLGQRFRTLSTPGNFNNDIGMPLSLLQLNRGHQWAVLELGMNHPGEIRRLGDICQPDIGMITTIASAHLEGLGSIEGVANAKAELFQTLKKGGTAVLNADDRRVMALKDHPFLDRQRSRIIFYGVSNRADIRAESICSNGIGTDFTLVLPTERIPIKLQVPGRFMVSNALAAATAGYLCGLDAAVIRNGLEQFTAVPGRMNVIQTSKQFSIIDDTYNANPGSMKAAVTTLGTLKKNHRGFLVVGDMFELGCDAASIHEDIGRFAVRSGIDGLYITGKFAETVAGGAIAEGLDSKQVFIGSHEEIGERLGWMLEPGDWVLIKGSRAMKMEKIVEQLRQS